MKTDASSTLKAFATLRFEGDALVPSVLDEALRVRPTLSYRNGEAYTLGRRGIEKVGETGYWFLNTKDVLETADLDEHSAFIAKILTDTSRPGGDVTRDFLSAIVSRYDLSVWVTLFWFGRSGARAPKVPVRLGRVVKSLGGTIETDFATAGSDPAEAEGRAA